MEYSDQKKAWMTGEIMHTLLSMLNTTLSKQSRSIILFMDNAGYHSEDMYSNIKVVFLPPNTTSVLQPIDLGIIKNFKVHYSKLLLCHILTKITTAHDVVKSVTILNAIRWVAQAWENVTADTIRKWFRKAGILNKEFQAARIGDDDSEEDPFTYLDENPDMEDLESLISQIQTGDDTYSVEEFINADCEVPVCEVIFDDNWERKFLGHVAEESASKATAEDICSSESEEEEQDEVPRLKNFAILQSARQSTLDQYSVL